MVNIKSKFIDNNRYLFVVTSIIFGLCYLFQVPHGDDVNFYVVESGKLIDCFNKSLLLTEGSFYSLLTNTFVMYINNGPFWIFILIMMITMYIMQESMREIFSKGNKNERIINTFIACIICAYPFVDMASAGWIDTSLSYFLPITFTFVALIPIKKIYNNEIIKGYEYFIYIISLLIAIDNTQAVAMLLVCYLSFLIYSFITKKKNTYTYVVLLLIGIFAILAVTSPRFATRTRNEIVRNFPTYAMINFINKLDLGILPTFRWIFFADNFFVFICLLVFSIFIFKKYHNISYRALSILPLVCCIVCRNSINSNLSINAYDLKPIEYGSSNYGLFNVKAVFNDSILWQYIVLCGLLIVMVLEIILLVDELDDLIAICVLLIAGFGTRFAMALTPTVFASQLRTYIYFAFSIIAVTIYIFRINIKLINNKYYKYLEYILIICTILMLGYFFVYVYNYMGSSLFELLR